MPKTRAKNKSPASKSGTSPAKKSKIMTKETDLETPCFIVDMEKERIILLKKVPWAGNSYFRPSLNDSKKVRNNCTKMAKTAKDVNCGLRAHMKTHKTLEIGQLMAPDKKKITVSTLSEAEFFADGTDDLELDHSKAYSLTQVLRRVGNKYLILFGHIHLKRIR